MIRIWKHNDYWKVKPGSCGGLIDMALAFDYCLNLNVKSGLPDPMSMLPPFWPDMKILTVGDYTKMK